VTYQSGGGVCLKTLVGICLRSMRESSLGNPPSGQQIGPDFVG
jgi:hypothetical protein